MKIYQKDCLDFNFDIIKTIKTLENLKIEILTKLKENKNSLIANDLEKKLKTNIYHLSVVLAIQENLVVLSKRFKNTKICSQCAYMTRIVYALQTKEFLPIYKSYLSKIKKTIIPRRIHNAIYKNHNKRNKKHNKINKQTVWNFKFRP